MNGHELEQVLIDAFLLGQDYWRNADSDNPRDWPKSDITKRKFDALVSEALSLFNGVNELE